ncbi:hypothetical protein FQN55_005017 [Onygenales sp. PD_40]|nr:hypothetical protein FQN55_005017 [Onygenales sp. PD_40]KAK2783068.1 hypothetical protein FQN53_009372 [Emmonsiellopsis sp. PD_33]KAK2788783.1 hypothetical protein FQN52_006539 [Onygenales sp. PD_12]
MRASIFLLGLVSAFGSADGCPFTQPVTGTDKAGCNALTGVFSDEVFYKESAVYEYEVKNFWSNTQILSPSCIYRPTSGSHLAAAIKLLKTAKASFAVRGGGHMGIKGANSIDNGVLIVMSNLTTMALSDDNSVLSLGPGHKWGQVYEFLEPKSLAVAGGRLAPVGVPGLLLGGGISFHGNSQGFACDNVVNYEIALADGSLVNANKDVNSDLFWALKGGSSNFGIVTKFDLRTFTSTKAWAGIITIAEEYIPDVLAAIATFSADFSDPKSHIVPAIIAGENPVAAVILYYDSPTINDPDCFKPFMNIPSIGNTLDFKTLPEFALETGTAVVPGINNIFVAGSVVGKTKEELEQGVKIINDVFFDALPALYAQIPAENIVVIQLDWQPVGAMWMKASASKGGNALGLDPSKGTYLMYAEVVEWRGSEYDEIVNSWVESTTYAINNATKEAGLYDSFNYMGDAAGFQSVIPEYGAANVAKLKDIAKKYDPSGVFQKLMPGGFKV